MEVQPLSWHLRHRGSVQWACNNRTEITVGRRDEPNQMLQRHVGFDKDVTSFTDCRARPPSFRQPQNALSRRG